MNTNQTIQNHNSSTLLLSQKHWTSSPDGQCNYVNDVWCNYTGQDLNRAAGEGRLNAIHPADQYRIEKIYLDSSKHQVAFRSEYRLKNRKGEYRWHMELGTPKFSNNHFEGFEAMVIDIDDQRMAEQKYHDSETLYKDFAEAMPQMAFIANAGGDIIYFNQRWYNYVNGMKGTEGWGWKDKPIHHPDDLQPTIDKWNHSLRTGENYEMEYRLRKHNGEYRWHLGRANPMRDEKGNVLRWLGTNTDIHAQKVAEEKLMLRNIELKKKNRITGRMNKLHRNLMRVIAHDLKGPLASMHMVVEIIQQVPDEKRDKMLKGLMDMVNRQEKVLDGLLDIIQVQTPGKLPSETIMVQKLTREITEGLQEGLEQVKGILNLTISEDIKIHYVDSFYRSIIRNLVSNAIKYRHHDRPLIIDITGIMTDGYFCVSVADNGIGIDLEKNRAALFEPFERFTNQAEGNGIGLYIIKNLIEENGGYMEVESTPGVGTTFTCFFKEFEI